MEINATLLWGKPTTLLDNGVINSLKRCIILVEIPSISGILYLDNIVKNIKISFIYYFNMKTLLTLITKVLSQRSLAQNYYWHQVLFLTVLKIFVQCSLNE